MKAKRVVTWAAVVASLGSSGYATAAVDFGPRIAITTGPLTADVAVGDINADALADIVALPAQTGVVPVPLIGGVFTPGLATPIGIIAQNFVLVDVNNDTRPDVVAASAGANVVNVMLNSGSGVFGAPTRIGVGQRPAAIASGDLNADGFPDVAVTNAAGKSVSVLLGKGDGTFTVSTVPAGTGPVGIAIGDVTRDGRLDIVTTDEARKPGVVVLVGNGDGTFASTPLRSRVPDTGLSVAIGDLNRDGIPDLAQADFQTNRVTVVSGLGNGLFANPMRYDVSTSPFGLVIADLNADGISDIATANLDSGDVSVLEGLPVGFAAAKQFLVGRRALYLRAADVTNDGRTDLVVASGGRSTVVLPSRVLPPGTSGTAKTRVGCAHPRRVVVGESIACVTPGMSRAQVKEILGKATSRFSVGGGEALGFGRRGVFFSTGSNAVDGVFTDKPGDGTRAGVRVGGPAAAIKRRYPRATCAKPVRGAYDCALATSGIGTVTQFFVEKARVTAISVSFG